MGGNVIREFSLGKETAFRLLYEKYAGVSRYFAFKYVKEEDVVADVVQDVFVAMWEKRRDFETEESLKSFLYTAIRNRCLNIVRHRKVMNRYAEAVIREEEHDSFWDYVLEAELFELLTAVFNELPPACREVYRLSLNGKKYEEIAELLHISINTVKKHKANANRYMRERLKNILMLLLLIG